jgi:CHAT domain-containing protein
MSPRKDAVFFKTLTFMLAFSLWAFAHGCNTREHLKEQISESDQKTVIDLLRKSEVDSAIIISEVILNNLLSKDSLQKYAAFNKLFYDSLIARKNVQAGRFLLNIINEANKYDKSDSTTLSLLTQVYYYYADAYPKDQFNDTLVSFFENAILLNSTYNALDPLETVWIYKSLGIQYNIAGDLIKSIKNYDLEAKTYQTISNKGKINYDYLSGSIINQAILLEEMGHFDSVTKRINSVISKPGIKQYKKGNLFLLRSLSEFDAGKKEDSKNSIESAEKIIKTYVCKDGSDSIALNDLRSLFFATKGKIANKERQYAQSKESFKTALFYRSLVPQSSIRYYGKQLIMLGNALLDLHNNDSAVLFFQKALSILSNCDSSDVFKQPSISQLYAENTLMQGLDSKGDVLQLLYKQTSNIKYLTTAIQCYYLSFEVEKKLMQYFSYDDSKLLLLTESRLRSQKAITLCYQLYQLTKENQWAQKAFQFAEKNKAFVLLESVKRNLAANSTLQNDTLYKNVQHLQLQLAYAERSLAEATGDSAKQKLQQQKTKLDNDLLFANTALGRQSIAYKTVMEKQDSISAAAVSEGLLNEHTGLIEFFNADSVTYAFVLNKNQPIQFIKYDAMLSSSIDLMLYFFKSASAIGNNPLLFQKAAYQVYHNLGLDKMDKAWQNLIIIPDGKLSFLPFDALITNTSFTVNLQQAGYFINQCNTLYGYSAAILLKQLDNNRPVYNNKTVFAPVFVNGENNQQPLQYSLQEANAISANINTTSFIKERATLDNFRQQFSNAGVLHIATHAYGDTGLNNNPKIEFIDSSLLLNELYAMHTDASLLVLSACETGLGRLNSSEGPMSLARGFYYAGAKNVITSYWNVDDKSTAALFSSFYKKLENEISSNAINESKKELIKMEAGKFASPYYWAGFVHFGLPQKEESKNYWCLLLLLPAAVIVLYKLRR